MLRILRRYQKAIFVLITVVTVASFAFFGTFSIYDMGSGASEKVDEKSALVRFFDGGERLFINDRFFEREILITGIGSVIAQKYWDELKGEIGERFAKVKQYRPGEAVEGVWAQFFPEMLADFRKVQEGQVTPETFGKLVKLYIDQQMFTPEMMKRVLIYQKIEPQGDYHLFGFESMEDWFGPKFMQISAAFVLNGAAVGEARGYRVTKGQSRQEMVRNIYERGKQYGMLTQEDAQASFRAAMQQMGVDEQQMVGLYAKMMLFRQFFHDVGDSVGIDRFSYQKIADFAGQRVKVEMYELPEELRFKDLDTMLKFQVYLEAVSKQKGAQLLLPSSLLSPEEVERRFPELVQTVFEVSYSEIDKEELAQRVTVKEMWDWQVEEANWQMLRKKFSNLPLIVDKKERIRAIEKGGEEIDRFSRLQIVNNHPEWIEEALGQLEPKRERIGLRSKGGSLPFKGIERQALHTARVGELKQFCGDGKHLYQIKILNRGDKKELVPFREALKDGTLQAGSKAAYGELLKAIEDDARAQKEIVPAEPPDVFYSSHRLFAHMRHCLSSGDVGPIWPLVKSEKEIARSEMHGMTRQELFKLKAGELSTVQIGRGGALTFFRNMGPVKSEESQLSLKMDEGQKLLSLDARRTLTMQLLQEMVEKKSIEF